MTYLLTLLLLFFNNAFATEITCNKVIEKNVLELEKKVKELTLFNKHNCNDLKRLFEQNLFHSYNSEYNTLFGEYLASETSEMKSKIDGVNYNWTYEYIGLDIVAEELRSTSSSTIAILDSGFDGILKPQDIINNTDELSGDHGTHVSYLASTGVKNKLNYIGVVNSDGFQIAADHFQEKGYPNIVNSSSLYYANKRSHSGINQLIKNKTIVVASGGNYFPDFIPQYSDLYKNIIHAGWLSSNGQLHPNSTEGGHIDITVPVDNHTSSSIKEGTLSAFGGSSAAAPIVASTIGALIEILGTNDIDIIQPILLNSSLSYPFPLEGNGNGVLNSYRSFKVAKRISEKCNKDGNVDVECMRLEVKNNQNFQFDINIDDYTKKALDIIPSCKNNKPELHRAQNCEIHKIMKALRKGFLLTQDKNTASLLACLNNSLTFYETGVFYENFSKEPELIKEDLRKESPEVFFRYARHIEPINQEELKLKIEQLKKEFEGSYDRGSLEGLIYYLETRNDYKEFLPSVLEMMKKLETYEEIAYGGIDENGKQKEYHLGSTDFKINMLKSEAPILKDIAFYLIDNNLLGLGQLQELVCYDYHNNNNKGFAERYKSKYPDRFDDLFRHGLKLSCEHIAKTERSVTD